MDYEYTALSSIAPKKENGMQEENQVLIVDKSGTGQVLHYRVNRSWRDFESSKPVQISKWKETANWSDFSLCVLHNELYMAGGLDHSKATYSNRFLRYSPKTETWTILKSMAIKRSNFPLVYYEGCIYALGGETPNSTTTRCERYDLRTGSWETTFSLPEPRKNHPAVVCEGLLFTSGGIRDTVSTDTVWYFDGTQWQWVDSALPKPVDRHAMVSLDDVIYFVAGVTYFSLKGKKGLQKMAARTNNTLLSAQVRIRTAKSLPRAIVELTWDENLPYMLNGRSEGGVVQLEKNIYVLGGVEMEKRVPVYQTEHFSPVTKTWHDGFDIKQELGVNRSHAVKLTSLITAEEELKRSGKIPIPTKWIFW